jgi:hypothetical protein
MENKKRAEKIFIIAIALSALIGAFNNRYNLDTYTIFNCVLSLTFIGFMIYLSFKYLLFSVASLIYWGLILLITFFSWTIQTKLDSNTSEVIFDIQQKILLSPILGVSFIWKNMYEEGRGILSGILFILIIPLIMGSISITSIFSQIEHKKRAKKIAEQNKKI